MKRYILILLVGLLTLPYWVSAQNIISPKLCAYGRLISGGAPLSNENGELINTSHYQYDIFLETISKIKPEVQQLWIKNHLYTVQVISVKKLPVTTISGKKKQILVKKSTKKVWQFVLMPSDSKETSVADLPKEAKNNELVVLLKNYKKKITVKSIVELPQIITE